MTARMAGRVTSASIYAMVCTHRKVDVMLLDLTDGVLVLAIVLKAPEHLQYQLAFLSTVGWQTAVSIIARIFC